MNLRDGFREIVDGWALVDDFDDLTDRIERLAIWTEVNRPLTEDETSTVVFMIECQIARGMDVHWFEEAQVMPANPDWPDRVTFYEAMVAHFGATVICTQCGATVEDIATRCKAAKETGCPGGETVFRYMRDTLAGVSPDGAVPRA